MLRNEYHLTLGYWEAKDADDDLDREVQRKIERGYSLQNTIFKAPGRAILYQDRRPILDTPLARPQDLVEVLDRFFRYREPQARAAPPHRRKEGRPEQAQNARSTPSE